ncbi:acyl-CoA dehydrogenase family protein [Streptomyces sp. H27-D2]|uniref:acyl-CoA dehydrogenase family protein n=1 Tax=Streptomyces sp. H27-D2 TaxID=3046304 RepID=UPI002DB88081|nr:acyl-CoA dehydrogenase family protein [Streptomyces sp. H27-D2]MEC4017648.1 acyl-CoA dehydrogenase family protein [Streptomyces sp. H27-D2]
MAPEDRIDALERAFGPLEDPGNALGQEALLAADADGDVLAVAERVLDTYAFNAEFVPEELGGRLARMDVLGRVLRPVFRRDASVGFGYGLNCFFAATPVWTAGGPAQRAAAARLLLDGRRIAVVRHEVAHGNDFVRDEFTATPADDGFLLNGSKAVIANASRAAGLVVFARTAQEGGGRSHSVLLLDRAELPAERLRDLARHATTGMRSAEFGGLEAVDCPVPGDALVGGLGDGYELSLRSSLVIRGLIPSIVLAGADTALRTVARFAVRRRDDGRSSLDVQHVRDVLTGSFLDLLLSDCLALVATRALHLLPQQMSAYAAAAAYLAPKIIAESMDEMSAVLGEESFAEDGAYAMFQKQLRDLPVTSLGHAGSAGRQVSILPQLPFFARHAWFSDREAPAELFRLHEGLPPLDLGRPALLGDSDPLAATLVAVGEQLEAGSTAFAGSTASAADTGATAAKTSAAGPGPDHRDDAHAPDDPNGRHDPNDPNDPNAAQQENLEALRHLTRSLVTELGELRKVFASMEPGDRKALVSPHSFAQADRYALVLAGAACLGVWREQRAGDDAFLADPAWPTAALYRLCRRLGLPLPERPVACEQRVLAEALARLHGRRSYDLYGSALA